MSLCQKVLFIYQLLFLSIILGCVSKTKDEIPFPKALEDASIKVDNLENILDGSLIVGNGDINALIYSDSNSIVMNLTKNDVWDARLETSDDPPIPTLDLIKQLGNSETAFPLTNSNSSYVLPEGNKWDKIDSYHSAAYPCPRQCARIIISIKENSIELNGELNLRHAIAKIKKVGSSINLFESRALANRNVFLIQTEGELEIESIKSEGLSEAFEGETNNVLWIKQEIPGDLDWPGMEFAVAAASSGNLKAVAVVSSIESDDVIKESVKLAIETVEYNYDLLIKDHESIWESFWSGSGIEMDNKFLQSTWYRSLYFLRCFSKPGVQSVGLFAGLINDTPAWHGDYHTNYNIQQMFWSAYPSNHPEIAEPYDRLMFNYLRRAKWLSQKVFAIEGAYYPHVMYAYEPEDPTKSKSRNNRQYIHHTWGMTLGVNGFSVQPVWWRYKYDPDPMRLKNIVFPLINEVASFYAQFVEECEGEKTIRLGPSVSPEHWGWTKNLDRNYNCSFDIAYIRYTLNAAIEATQILEQDDSLIQRYQKALSRLPDYPLYGEEKPIVVDVENAPPIEYNIPVPATPVFPGDVVTWWSSNKEKLLFERTIDSLKWNGNNATFMLAIARSRLSMPNSQEWLESEIKNRTRPNAVISLNTLLPPKRFNDYGHYTEQFGAGMAISELLLQSVGDIIRIFPASSAGNRISFVNLRAQGGFLVSAEGIPGNVNRLQIKSIYGGELKLLSPWQEIEAGRIDDENYSLLEKDQKGVVKIQTKPGETWLFRKLKS